MYQFRQNKYTKDKNFFFNLLYNIKNLLFTISDSSNKIAFILLLLGVLVYYGLVISGNNPL